MATATAIPKYAFDPTGRLASNLVKAEPHALTGVNGHDFYFFIPQYAPFFKDGFKIIYKTLTGETRPLVEGVDFYFSHYFLGASRACNKPVYSSISVLNRALVGTVIIEYQTLGGEWIKDANVISEVLADRIHNPRVTTWEQVVDMPGLFPVVNHEWNLVDMVGMSQVVAAINKMADKILQAGSSLSNQHITARGNPHGLTAADINAVTTDVLKAEVTKAVRNAGAGVTDNMTEGTKNLFFTEQRVRDTKLGVLSETVTAQPIAAADEFSDAMVKLQKQITATNQVVSGKAASTNPVFTGIIMEHLEPMAATTAETILPLRKASTWRVNVGVSTAIVFDKTGIANATGKTIDLSLIHI